MIYIKGREVPPPDLSPKEKTAILRGKIVTAEITGYRIGDRFAIEGKPVFCTHSGRRSKFRLMAPEEVAYSTGEES